MGDTPRKKSTLLAIQVPCPTPLNHPSRGIVMRNELDPAQPLTNPRHEAFVQALLRGEPATQAYALAGFKPNRANAARLTTNDDITARLAHLKSLVTAQVIAETAIAVADVVEELAKLGFSNMKRYAHIRSAADIAELPEEYAAAVQELTIEEYIGRPWRRRTSREKGPHQAPWQGEPARQHR